jgi:hypothetical protein
MILEESAATVDVLSGNGGLQANDRKYRAANLALPGLQVVQCRIRARIRSRTNQRAENSIFTIDGDSAKIEAMAEFPEPTSVWLTADRTWVSEGHFS